MAGYRKLGRTSSQRKAMLRSLVTALFQHGKIKTTLTRAKEARSVAEKLITQAKSASLSARRSALGYIYDKNTAHRLVDEIAPFYKTREGGYTRIYKLDERVGDNAPMAVLELVDYEAITSKDEKKEAITKLKSKASRKKAAAKEQPAKDSQPAKTSAEKETAQQPAADAEATAAQDENTEE